MLPWIFKKALERDAKFNDAGRDEDFAPVFNVGVLVHGKIPLVGYIPCLLDVALSLSRVLQATTSSYLGTG